MASVPVPEQGVVLGSSGAVALEEIQVSAPEPGEVLVRIEATGVCHSDLHVIEEDGWGHPYPVLLGHEGAGTIEAVGPGVDDLAEGDRVVLGWKTACGSCSTCLRGAPRRCKRPPAATGRLLRRDGSVLTPVLRTGTFATHTVVPRVAAVKVPRELPVEQACLIGCAVATGVMSVLETAKVWAGARVAVIGCGAVGLSAIQGARIVGASEIRAIDLDERKLEQATRFGATHTEPGPRRLRLRRRRTAIDGRAGARATELGRHIRPDRAFAGRRDRRARPAGVVREADHDSRVARWRPSAGGGLPTPCAVGARGQA